jgi:tetratricopeptide (TPR) repeat protein
MALLGIAAVVAALAVAGYFALRPRAAPPIEPAVAASVDPGPHGEAVALQKSLAEGKRLYDEGKYEESLVILRTVLDRDPENPEARQLADQAENAIKVHAEQVGRTAQIQAALELARQSFTAKKWEEARNRADAVLVLDAQNAEATRLRDDAAAQIERAVAEKKKVEAQLAKIRAMTKNVPQTAQKVEVQGPAVPPPEPAAAGSATLRLLFDSPISQGHVMVAINDQILLRRPYNFKKKAGLFKTLEGTGTVSANIPVPTGPVTVKVWLSGPDISPAFATATASMLPAETRTLKVDYADGHLGASIQ